MSEPQTIPGIVRSEVLRHPDRPVYTFLHEKGEEAGRLTCSELDRRARAVAAALRRHCARGDRALLLYPPGLEFVVAFFGCLYAEVVAVPVYPPRPRRGRSRLQAIVLDAAPRVALTSTALLSRIEQLAAEVPELAAVRRVVTDGLEEGDGEGPDAAPDALAFLQYTSGSTALPKGVMVTHANLLHNQRMIQAAFGQDESSVVVGWLPLYHDMGLIGNVLQPLWCGGQCVLMSPLAFLQRPRRWLEAISRYRGTTSGGPNFAYDLCVRKIGPEERLGLDLSSWRVAFNGAELVRAETLAQFAEAFGPCGFAPEAFYPCYGLAEATLFVTGGVRGLPPRIEALESAALERHEVVTAAAPAAVTASRRVVSSGRPWHGQRVVIADPATGRECPPDRVGEIWIQGPSVAAGYWQRPEETERCFRASPATPAVEPTIDPGAPFLRTGDLGFLRDGELFVTGRIKDLIIVRGRNVYPQDLELAAAQCHPALRPGCGAAFAVEMDGQERLIVVHEVDRSGERGLAPEEIALEVRRAIAEEHEIQAHEVVLVRAGTIPKTSSGKIQRYACRAAYLDGSLAVLARSVVAENGDTVDGAAPQTSPETAGLEEVEELLRATFAGLARVHPQSVAPERPLSALGLDSLIAAELKTVIETELEVSFSLAELLEGPSVRELARQVLARCGAAAEGPDLAEPSGPETAGRPLSYGQKSLWFLHRLDPGSAAYNIAGAARLVADVAPDRLRRAFQALFDRHAALRTLYAEGPDGPLQWVQERAEVPFTCLDASDWEDEEVRRYLHEVAFQPFDLERGPLFRAALVRRGGEGRDLLALAVHHIAADFQSLAVLVRELGALCSQPAAAPAPAGRYTDFTRLQERALAGPEGERLWRYWHERLLDAPPLDLPADRPRTPAQTSRGASSVLRLPGLAEGMRALARRAGCTFFTATCAGFALQLARYSGQEDLVLGTPTSGRVWDGMGQELADRVGYFVNPLALRVDVSGDPAALDWLARVHRTVLAAFAHQSFPYPLLVERLQALRADRDLSRSPLFQTMFVLQRAPRPELEPLTAFALGEAGARLEVGGLSLESLALRPLAAQRDLTLMLAESGGDLAVALEWDADLFDATTGERMLGHCGNLLRALAGGGDRWISELPLLGEAERRQIVCDWNRTSTGYPREATIDQLFAEQAGATPERIALAAPGSLSGEVLQVTYAELCRRAGFLARHLRSLGIGPEDRVGVALDRSVEMVVSWLGVLAAGGAYVPLSPSDPKERLATMANEASLRFLIGEERRLPVLEPAAPPAAGSTPENLAYVMFTSGSTGAPKAVGVPHRAVVRLVRAMDYADLGPRQVFLQLAPPAFDASTLEVWGPLLNGGRLVLFPPAVRPASAELGAVLQRHEVTALWLTAGLFHQTVETGLEGLRTVSQLLAGGDVLSPEHVNRVLTELPGCVVINGYGPTENTTFTCCHPVREPVPPGLTVPIGRPIANTYVHVLGRDLQPVPVGVPGELFAGGDGLARGYLNRPDLTAQRFVPDPFAAAPGARLYRTGDLVRRRPGGGIDFIGRLDSQVKIRGFRVEPGEVEGALSLHPAVREVAVIARRDAAAKAGMERLVAYVTTDRTPPPTLAELREFLRERLPEPMLPAVVVVLKSFPLTANGKLDRRALPEPAGAAGPTLPDVPPRTPVEELLAALWEDLLGVEHVGAEDSFFDLGGHSLLATRLVSRVRGTFGVELPLDKLFANPVLRDLAAAVEGLRGSPSAVCATPVTPVPRHGAVPLSYGQERLWFLHQLAPGGSTYNVSTGLELRGRLQVAALTCSLHEIVRRHEALRTSFHLRDGHPVQVVHPVMPVPLPLIDLAALPGAAEESRRLIDAEVRRPFDLERAPLLRATLLRLAAGEHLLLVSMHHLVSDGWSLTLLEREIGELYAAFLEGRPAPLPDPAVQYADFAEWQLRNDPEEHLAYWRGRLGGTLPVLEL
ncbi:MAG TPA: amino acid adenylation domain-containing protein, partial [Thermoanaerobaculia bacterium]|nr:amino acid adenylation domain-containing protein [Thermoanaerobaculia bacterium]